MGLQLIKIFLLYMLNVTLFTNGQFVDPEEGTSLCNETERCLNKGVCKDQGKTVNPLSSGLIESMAL